MYRLVLSLFLIVCLFAVPAQASLGDALNGMFMRTGTRPQAYNSQTRQGFVGGSYSLRTPIKNMQVISFAAPRIDAGCGGIDMFMGAFSFINAQQFTNLLRAIGANAVGYAFKMAIQAMCPSCSADLSELENNINALNRHMKNTCAIASMAVDAVGSAVSGKQQANQIGKLLDTSLNKVNSAFDAVNNLFSNPQSAVQTAPDENPDVGNLVWKALYNNNTGAFIGNPGTGVADFLGSDSLLMAQYIMSLTGSVILSPTDPTCSSSQAGDRCSQPSITIDPTLSFRDLINGDTEDESPKYWKCDKTDSQLACLNPTLQPFTFTGTRGYTNKMLFGNDNGPDQGIDADSIVGRIESAEPLSSTQQAFVNAVKIPIIKMMLSVQKEPVAVEMVARVSAPLIQEEMAITLGHAVVRAAKAAFNGQTNVAKPKFFDRNIRSIEQDMNSYHLDAQKHVKTLVELYELVNVIRKSMPGSLS